MKLGPQMALAVGAGYLLGRQRRLRSALVLVGAAAIGRLSRNPGQLLAHGTKALTRSAELRRVAEMGAPLLEAGRAAARTAVSNRIDSVSERLQDRSEALRRAPGRVAGTPGTRRQKPGGEAAPEEEREDYEEYDEQQYDDDQPYDDGQQYEDEPEPEDEPEESPPPRTQRRRSTEAPVRRRGR